MEAFLISVGLVAVGEIGDKTQLLAMLLATRYRRPVPIILGILVATLANHALAAWAGATVAAWLGPTLMRWILASTFFAMAAWCLVPDTVDAEPRAVDRAGAFVATAIAFFLCEIGDKTQIATVALAANYRNLLPVVCGTTAGMLLANVPVVLIGGAAAMRIPIKLLNRIAAAAFIVLGILTLLGHGGIG